MIVLLLKKNKIGGSFDFCFPKNGKINQALVFILVYRPCPILSTCPMAGMKSFFRDMTR